MEASSISSDLQARDGDEPIAPCAEPGPTRTGEPISGSIQCGCCGRTLLIGEDATLRARRSRARWFCRLCDGTRRTRFAGRPVRTARVRSLGGAMNVRSLR